MKTTENRVENNERNGATTVRRGVRPALKWTLVASLAAYAALFLDPAAQDWIVKNQFPVLAKSLFALFGSPAALFLLGLALMVAAASAEIARRPALFRRWTRLWRLSLYRRFASAGVGEAAR